jgi:hypothetical protein
MRAARSGFLVFALKIVREPAHRWSLPLISAGLSVSCAVAFPVSLPKRVREALFGVPVLPSLQWAEIARRRGSSKAARSYQSAQRQVQ